jgi:hypothetical protein
MSQIMIENTSLIQKELSSSINFCNYILMQNILNDALMKRNNKNNTFEKNQNF